MTLTEWGWNDDWAQLAAELDIEASRVARIVGQDRASWSMRTSSEVRAGRLPSTAYTHPPVVGDWVVAEPGPMPDDPWSIVLVLPRRSWISRGSAGTGTAEQILAANVDTVWIVHGLDADLNRRRLERYLAVTWDSGATPEIVLTKADLAADVEGSVSEVEAVAIGVAVRIVSAKDPESVRTLRDTLKPGSTVSLLGPSGVGKSTLVNLLSDTTVATTREVRTADRKGRHTTTRRELYRIPGGALLLDTPGMRELRIWALEEGLDHTFPEIEALARGCRFRDCRHDGEPGCAVLEAVETGDLEPERLQSYKKLQAEAAYEARKSDPIARAALRSEWKSVMKSLKHHPKYKDRK